MNILMSLVLLLVGGCAYGQAGNIQAHIETVSIEFQGKTVDAKRLTVSSNIPLGIDTAWAIVQTPELLQFIAKGVIKFLPVDGKFPPKWEMGETYATKMRILGFIPFGGIHRLHIQKIDGEFHQIITCEWDKRAKVWNHQVTMRRLENGGIHYEDVIVIYGKRMTGFISSFAKTFYRHRQKRWQIIAKEKLIFSK